MTAAAPPPKRNGVEEIEPYKSPLTRAEFDAVVEIEEMMANGCEGMFARDGGKLPEALAESMEKRGLLASQWMEAHPDYPGENPDGGAAYWPTGRARFLRGMCMVGLGLGRVVTWTDDEDTEMKVPS